MNRSTKNYWMHRITHEREVKESLLKNEGLLLTAWGDLSNDRFLKSMIGKGKLEFDEIFKEETGNLPRNRFFLYMFINEFKKGDYILVPGLRDFSVYEIVSDSPFSKEQLKECISHPDKLNLTERDGRYFQKDNGAELELGFFWKVSPVELNISREHHAVDSLRRRLKFQGTNNNFTQLGQEVEDAIKRHRDNAPLKSKIVDFAWDLVYRNLQSVSSDSTFEKAVKYYLERLGATDVFIPAKTCLSKAPGDADVIAVFEALRVKIIVQVKHYLEPVDAEAVKQILASQSVYDDSTNTVIPWVVAACDTFTDEAQMLAEENGVRLMTCYEFSRSLLDVGFRSFDI